jgi:hypothetical protein
VAFFGKDTREEEDEALQSPEKGIERLEAFEGAASRVESEGGSWTRRWVWSAMSRTAPRGTLEVFSKTETESWNGAVALPEEGVMAAHLGRPRTLQGPGGRLASIK